MIVILAGKLVGLITIDLGRGRAILDRATAEILPAPLCMASRVRGGSGSCLQSFGKPLSMTSRVGAMKYELSGRSYATKELDTRQRQNVLQRDLAIRDNSPREKEKDLPRAKGKTED
ncbi:hypothetical protein NM208_g14215 [Fusarium decemcellulare]|uniref:Uncharacterized protein n=1 Tax=Fusarium decemcellulare TaxID=57161 RepID=A0ACC1RIQ2_9HYPO|nr:hypothetical protein NM208_g14215 [Fusarium decemcellulare]